MRASILLLAVALCGCPLVPVLVVTPDGGPQRGATVGAGVGAGVGALLSTTDRDRYDVHVAGF